MKSFRSVFLAAVALLGCFPAIALAHVGDHSGGFAAGASHPLGGLDHLLAMLAVGLWAAQQGGRVVWAAPLGFVGAMLLGGVLGIVGVSVPFVEAGILASVLVLGLCIAGALRLQAAQAAGLVALFALFHGHAHGAEMPAMSSALVYVVGFVIVTASLHIAGILAGRYLVARSAGLPMRLAGGSIALLGAYLGFV